MKGDTAKKSRDFTATFTVDQTPEQAFEAITNVRGWWSGEIDGPTDELGGEFTYRYQDIHYSKQKVTELVRGKRVVWLVLDSYLEFIEDKREWNGSRVIFDIARKGDKTEVRFTHAGLVPAHECYGACSSAWSSYIRGSLRSLIATGKGSPNPEEKTQKKFNGSASARA
jgi:Activator of Hsp90 ATPase homolog 1-like protein